MTPADELRIWESLSAVGVAATEDCDFDRAEQLCDAAKLELQRVRRAREAQHAERAA